MGEKVEHWDTTGTAIKEFSEDELIRFVLKDIDEQKESNKQFVAWEREANVRARDLYDVVDEAERVFLREIFSVARKIFPAIQALRIRLRVNNTSTSNFWRHRLGD